MFSLVFWSSLGVEWALAFGADDDTVGAQADTQQPSSAENPGTGVGTSSESGDGSNNGNGSGNTNDVPGTDTGGTGGNTSTTPTEDELQHERDVAAAQAVIDAIVELRGATADDRARVDAVLAQLASLTPEQQALVPDAVKQELQDISNHVDELIAERDNNEDEFTEEERFIASKHSEGTLVDIEAWSLDEDDPGSEYAKEPIRNVRQTADEQGYQTPKISTINGMLQIIAVPKWQSDTELESDWKPKALKADFLKWSVVGNEGYAEVQTDGGILTVKSLSEGSFLVTCTVDDGKNEKGEQVGTDYTNLIYSDFSDEYPGKSFTVMFSVEVLGPYIDIELLQSDGTTCAGLESLSLTTEQLKSYAFQANVRVYDQVKEGAIDEFRCTSTLGLKEASAAKYGELFDDLTWQVLDADRNPVDERIATISDMGVLEFTGDIAKDGPIIVRASSPNGFNQNPASAEVRIGTWVEDPQGESHPQETLRITSNARVDGAANEEDAAASSEATEPNPENNSPEGEDASTNEEPNVPGDGAEGTDAEGAEQNDSEKAQAIDKIYTVAQIEALGKNVETFTMQGSDGLMTVRGEGVSLKLLLADAGITDLTQVKSIDFIDYTGASTSVTWADISSGTQEPFVAVRSRVLTEKEGSNEGTTGVDDPGNADDSGDADGSGDAELLDNTRFRLLFYGSASIDPNALRWIKHIRVNVASDEGSSEESDLAVRVDYVPVPRGKQAVLSAIPSQAIGSARFGFSWETSADGENWTPVPNGEVQTLRLMTDDSQIGRWYRVVLETDMLDPQTGESLEATSKPVQIKEGSGFMAILAYDPPVAGQTAIFQSSVEAYVDGQQISIDPAQLKYEWQKSEDGGASWQRIDGATGPSFAVPTEPVAEQKPAANAGDGESDAESDAAQDPEPVTLIYVRVVVTTTDTRIPEQARIAESNAQPLTVRVGGGDDPNSDNSGTNDDVDQQGSAPQLPIDEQSPAAQAPISPTAGSIDGMTEITNIHVDNTPRPSVTQEPTSNPVTPQQTQPEQAPAQASSAVNAQEIKPDELLINPEITALVQEQEAAIDKAVTNSRPGARWTQLSTVEPTNDDVRRILADNPFAPFAIPLGLGIAVAGGLEKLLAFRREID